MFKVRQATKSGWIELCEGGVADLSYPMSSTRRGRVQGDGLICPTLTANVGGGSRYKRFKRSPICQKINCKRNVEIDGTQQ